MRRVVALLTLLGTGLFVLGFLVLGQVYEAWCADRIYPGVRVWDVPVGGLRRAEASEALAKEMTALAQPSFTLRGPDRDWQVRPLDLGIGLAEEATVEKAFQVGRAPGEGRFHHLLLLVAGHNLPPVLSYNEATARLYLETLVEQIDRAPQDAALTMKGTTPTAWAAEPGRELDVDATLAALADYSRLGSGEIQLVARLIPPQILDAESARAEAEDLLSEPFVLLFPNPREGDPGPWTLSPQELAPMLTTVPTGGRLEITLKPEPMQARLEQLAAELAIEPTNARFHFDEATGQLVTIAPSTNGRALDVAASLEAARAAIESGQHVAPLTVVVAPAPYPEGATAEELGIRELVSEGDSYFIGSPSGRDHNIRLAAGKFDGLVIGPGETFSFNEWLGEVTAEEGYDDSLITAGEQLAVGIGGGICQVSTTVFRAALWGGYPIVERWYHYQRVGYYELRGYGPGFDATVFSPNVDFKFVNDRDAPLLIETEVEENAHRLVFRFYSTDDGRQVEIDGPTITDETEPGPPIYQLDEDLPEGEVIEWQSAQDGLTATVERRVYDAAGELISHNIFVSPYAPRRAAYHYGPGYEPADES